MIRGVRTLALLPWVVACGASDGGEDVGALAVDSAGVAIVEASVPPETMWRLAEEPALEIGAAAGVSGPVSVAAGGGGRILVVDGAVGEGGALRVFGPAGEPLLAYGGADDGAGAADVTATGDAGDRLQWAAPYRGDSIAAFDAASRTIRILGPDGALAREVAIPTWRREGAYGVPGYAAGAVGPMEDGGFLTYATGAIDRTATEGPQWYRHHLLRLAPEGERADTLGVFEVFLTWLGPNGPEPFPFGAVSFRAPYEGGFVFARGDTPEYGVFSADGSLSRIVRWGGAPPPVNGADLEAYRSWYLGRARAAGALDAETEARLSERLMGPLHPELRPAVSNLLVDDEGNVWLEEFRWVDPAEVPPEPRPATWNVFGPEGGWIARVQVPAGLLVTDVADGLVYGVAVGAEGTRTARVYPLQR